MWEGDYNNIIIQPLPHKTRSLGYGGGVVRAVGLIAQETYDHPLTDDIVEKVKREMSPAAARSPTEDLQYQL